MCQGFLCSNDRCKNDARTTCLVPALAHPGVELLTNARVTRLDTDGRRVTAVRASVAGKEQTLRARIVVLAAGALRTPQLLLTSGNLANSSGLVGRRLMRHLIDLYVLSVAPRFRRSAESKELGLNDFYFEGGQRLGNVQSFGMAPTIDYLRNRPGANVWRVLGPLAVPIAKLFASAPIVASMAEDDPSDDNRVTVAEDGLEIAYRKGRSDIERRRQLRRRMHRAFSRFGIVRVVGTSSRDGLGHVCGTATMGNDPGRSVLDRFNRAHDLQNLYVVDGSFFPSSGAMNPALTIAANALRVAHHLESVV
jgi:choline dehydrogenase-like flavoprotein